MTRVVEDRAPGLWISPQLDSDYASSARSVDEILQRTAAKWRVYADSPPVGGRVIFPAEPRGTLGPTHDLPLPDGRHEVPCCARRVARAPFQEKGHQATATSKTALKQRMPRADSIILFVNADRELLREAHHAMRCLPNTARARSEPHELSVPRRSLACSEQAFSRRQEAMYLRRRTRDMLYVSRAPSPSIPGCTRTDRHVRGESERSTWSLSQDNFRPPSPGRGAGS